MNNEEVKINNIEKETGSVSRYVTGFVITTILTVTVLLWDLYIFLPIFNGFNDMDPSPLLLVSGILFVVHVIATVVSIVMTIKLFLKKNEAKFWYIGLLILNLVIFLWVFVLEKRFVGWNG